MNEKYPERRGPTQLAVAGEGWFGGDFSFLLRTPPPFPPLRATFIRVTRRTRRTSSCLESFASVACAGGGSEMASAVGVTALDILRAALLFPLKSPTSEGLAAALVAGPRRHRVAAPATESAPPRATAEVDAMLFRYVHSTDVRRKVRVVVGRGGEIAAT